MLVLFSLKNGPFRKGTSFSCMLLPDLFRTTINFNISYLCKPLQVDAVKHPLWVCQTPSWYLVLLHSNLSASSLSWFLKGLSFRLQCLQWSQGEVSRDGLESSQQSGHMESLQVPHEGDLNGRPGTPRDSMPSYLWQEVTKHSTSGILLRTRKQTPRTQSRYGTQLSKALNSQLHSGTFMMSI